MVYKLGRRTPKSAPSIKFGSLLTGVLPDVPHAVNHFDKVDDWDAYNNDQFGVCGPCSVANSRKLVTKYLTDAEQSPTQADVYDLYRRSGNPNFDPATGRDDNGVDMQTMMEACARGGIGGVKMIAFAQVDHTKIEEIRAAVAIFGVVLFGVNLTVAQQSQTDAGLWDYRPAIPWGGHAIPAGVYTGNSGLLADIKVVSWGKVLGTTDRFLAHQLGEAWVPIWQENLTSRQFLEGIDLAKLAEAYKLLTGKVLPVSPVPPTPTPDPTPAPIPPFLIDIVKRAFDTLIARFSGNFIIKNILMLAEAFILQWLAKNPTFAVGLMESHAAGTLDPKTVLDQLFTLAEALAPEPWKTILARVHGLIDLLFS